LSNIFSKIVINGDCEIVLAAKLTGPRFKVQGLRGKTKTCWNSWGSWKGWVVYWF